MKKMITISAIILVIIISWFLLRVIICPFLYSSVGTCSLINYLRTFIPHPQISYSLSDLSLILKLEKETYSVNKPIVVDLIFQNKSKHPMWINGTFYDDSELEFDILKPDGSRPQRFMILSGKRNPLNITDFLKIRAGKEWVTKNDMSELYKLNQAGTYQVKVRYLNYNDGSKFGISAWTGEVESNAVTFEIVEK